MQAILTPNGNTDKSKIIDLEITAATRTQRYKESLKSLGLFFALALLFIPVPGLHFVLPPVLVILGISKAIRSLRYNHYLDKCEFTCPECSTQLNIETRYFDQYFVIDCIECRNQIKVEIAPIDCGIFLTKKYDL